MPKPKLDRAQSFNTPQSPSISKPQESIDLNLIIKKAVQLFDKANKDTYKLENALFPCYPDSDSYIKNLKSI